MATVEEQYHTGQLISAANLPPGLLARSDFICSEDAVYCGKECAVAGQVQRVILEGGDAEVELKVTGTRCEELLRFVTGAPAGVVRAHLCPAACDKLRSNPDFLHLGKVKKLPENAAKTWEINVQGEDENADLRKKMEAWNAAQGPGGDRVPASDDSSSSGKKKKKSKKKKKKEEKEKAKVKLGSKSASKKSLGVLYSNTGMDPDAKRRRILLRKLKKRLRKDKGSTSSSGSSSSESVETVMSGSILQDRSKVQRISELAPGVLAASMIGSMKPFVQQTQGNTWSMDEDSLPAIYGQYCRAFMIPRSSGGLQREALTLAHLCDQLAMGQVASALDTASQRLKSLEQVMQGQSWTTAQKLEIIPGAEATLASRGELQMAQKEAKLDGQAKPPGGSWEKGKGKNKGKEQSKAGGKDRGKGKQKEDSKK